MELTSDRLIIRPFQRSDLGEIQRILNAAFGDETTPLSERRSWLEWSRLSQVWLPRMHQVPYGDQAVVLKNSGKLIGAVGLVALLDVYDQLPGLGDGQPAQTTRAEVGLFWAIDPSCQRKGYATEAAQRLIDFAFQELKLARLLATTEYGNLASQAVMRHLGMTLLRNPYPDPPWLQVVGLLENQAAIG
jgi:RimJ/RimL family protein N-acetyltransferase